MEATFGPPPKTYSTPEEWVKGQLEEMGVDSEQLTVEQRKRVLEHFEKKLEVFKPPAEVSDKAREAQLEATRACLAAQQAADVKNRRLRRMPDALTQARRILPSTDQWIRDVAFDSIIYLLDEAPESMRPDPDPKLEPLRELLTRPGFPPSVRKMWNAVRAASWADGDIRQFGLRGARAALTHYQNVRLRMMKFAETCEKSADGRSKLPRELVMRLFVPAFNATHAAERLCLECATRFALKTDLQRMNSRHCSAKCDRAASSRELKREKRRAGDAHTKIKERDKGQAALDRAAPLMVNRVLDPEQTLLLREMITELQERESHSLTKRARRGPKPKPGKRQ
jgi:hypothetical protein